MKSKIFLILNNAIFKSKFSNLAGFQSSLKPQPLSVG